jgi:hypothetical protein
MVYYVGNKDIIDPYIEEFTNVVLKTQNYITSYDKEVIYKAMYDRDKNIISEWANYFKKHFDGMKNKIRRNREAINWSSNSEDYERIESISFIKAKEVVEE